MFTVEVKISYKLFLSCIQKLSESFVILSVHLLPHRLGARLNPRLIQPFIICYLVAITEVQYC